MLFICTYFIFELIQENSKKRSDKIIYFVAACCLTIFLGALQLFPTAEYFRYSWRSGADIRIFNYGFFEPIKSVSFIFPHFFPMIMQKQRWDPLIWELFRLFFCFLPFQIKTSNIRRFFCAYQ